MLLPPPLEPLPWLFPLRDLSDGARTVAVPGDRLRCLADFPRLCLERSRLCSRGGPWVLSLLERRGMATAPPPLLLPPRGPCAHAYARKVTIAHPSFEPKWLEPKWLRIFLPLNIYIYIYLFIYLFVYFYLFI